ncbi:MAG: 3'-5' exonuclease domain-containing protein 2 [Alistipes sp.]|nr:3'-5' exonuclease domain-containing protein 2 [Alistipes sp.]
MKVRSSYPAKIDNEATAQLPAIEFRGEVHIIDREEQVEEACRYLAKQRMIGFDTETRPSFKAGVSYRVSLLQLSSEERCYLFRLNRIPLGKELMRLLGNQQVLKIGADVAGDLRSLRQLRHFRDGGFVDLQTIIGEWGIEEKSLRKMSAIVLGKRVSKAQRLSNWESTQLTDKQQLYAATDAWVCVQIFKALEKSPKVKSNL